MKGDGSRFLGFLMLCAACGGAPQRVDRPEVAETPPERLDEPVEMRDPQSRTVTLRVTFDAGSADDPPERLGATNLAARLIAEGGTEALSYTELVRALYPMAGSITAEAGRDQTVFVGRVHRDRLDAFYPLFRDVLVHPRMDPEAFTRLREEAKAALTLELRGANDEALGKEVLQSMLYAGHPFGHPELGSETSLGALQLHDVEAQRARVFCLGRARLGIAGGYPADFAARVAADLAALPRCGTARADLPEAPRVSERQILLVSKPEAASTAISIGLATRVVPGGADHPALAFAFAFMGQHRQFGGVLFRKLRADRGLNYGDYAYSEHFQQDGWTRFPLANTSRREQYVSIWLRPVKPEHAHFALRAAVRELGRLVANGVSEEDMERTRTFVGRYYQLYTQTESRRLGFALDSRFYGIAGSHWESLRTAWRTLTRDQVNAVLRRHVDPARLSIALVAPRAEQLAEAIARDEPSPIAYESPKPEEILAEDREIAAYPLQIARERIRVVPVAEVFR
ncbi:MAG: insulinase family protein [Deltaproteobacteria bacterium]|nr:insulinase family protein [Deltaproteobacteria bacterium]